MYYDFRRKVHGICKSGAFNQVGLDPLPLRWGKRDGTWAGADGPRSAGSPILRLRLDVWRLDGIMVWVAV